MTQEEKAKAYDEVIERAKDILSYKEVRREDMEYLFPELKESEDERVRKELICYFEKYPSIVIGPFNTKECIAWLEKQGEQKPVDTAKQEMSDEEYCSLCMDINCDGCPYVDKSKHKEQKPVELEKEEKSRLMKKCVHRAYQQGYDTGFHMATTELEHKQEWNEEDKKKLEECRSIIKQWQDKQDNYYFEGKFDYATWLKSLKDRYTWKPSDEQIRELSIVATGKGWFSTEILSELLEQLKKLKE